MNDQTRNMDPHKLARIAMYLYAREYSNQKGGSMDFWDNLSGSSKRLCKQMLEDINKARPYIGKI